MEYQDYLNSMKDVQEKILEYIENNTDDEENFQNLINLFSNNKIGDDISKIKLIFRLINKISQNHFRNQHFYSKIGRILLHLYKTSKHKLSNIQIFDIFQNNKRMLLLVIEEKLLIMNEAIASQIYNYHNPNASYPYYFYPQIKSFIDKNSLKKINDTLNPKKDKEFFNTFAAKQKLGENDTQVCELIRTGKLNEFINYIKSNRLDLCSKVEPSIFETNKFLLKNRPTLIEYAIFFGQEEIFRYLFSNINRRSLSTESFYMYFAHCPNTTIFETLQKNHIESPPEDFNSIIKNNSFPIDSNKYDPYDIVLEEAIKCHHKTFINHILQTFTNNKVKNYNIENNFDKNIYAYSFRYCNFAYFPKDMNYKFIFYYACKYDYIEIVKLLMKHKYIYLNTPIITNNFFSLIQLIFIFEPNFKIYYFNEQTYYRNV